MDAADTSQNSPEDPRSPNTAQGAWPAGTTQEDRRCWLCGAPTRYLHCKITCTACGFMRDCTDL